MSGFTPGPWTAKSIPPSRIVDGTLIVDWGEIKSCVTIWRDYVNDDGNKCHRPIADVLHEQQANANLISAAPDLHAALKTFYNFFQQDGTPYWITKYKNQFTVGEQEVIDKMFADAAAALAKAVPE